MKKWSLAERVTYSWAAALIRPAPSLRRFPAGELRDRLLAEAEVVGTGPVPPELEEHQLLVPLIREGRVVAREPLDVVRDRHTAARARLTLSATQLSRGEPVLPTEYA